MDTEMLEVKRYIEKYQLIRPGDGVVVGVSGGPDSVFLLHALNELKNRMPFELQAVHVHHGIRGAEADRDAHFSEELCEKLEIPFRVVYVDAPAYAAQQGLSLEEAARILRYDALEKVRQQLAETGTAWIAVAHHLDDQAETVLHNLVRGAGLRGLAGMENRRDHVIRPLLSIKREDILKWLKWNHVPYVTDSTNENPQYTRNHIRTLVLPELKEINPEASVHIARSAALLREADDFFRQLAVRYVDEHVVWGPSVPLPEPKKQNEEMMPRSMALTMSSVKNEADVSGESTKLRSIALPVTELKAYPELVRQYVYIEMIRRIGTPLKDWSSVHFRDMDRLIFGPGNAHLDLPYRMSAEYRKKHLILQENQEVISVKRRKNHG